MNSIDNMSREKKLRINSILSLINQIVVIVHGLIIPRLFISCYGSTVYGLISSITQFLAYITLLESGFGPVVKSVLYKPIANNDIKTIESILKTSEKFFRRIAFIFIVSFLLVFLKDATKIVKYDGKASIKKVKIGY